MSHCIGRRTTLTLCDTREKRDGLSSAHLNATETTGAPGSRTLNRSALHVHLHVPFPSPVAQLQVSRPCPTSLFWRDRRLSALAKRPVVPSERRDRKILICSRASVAPFPSVSSHRSPFPFLSFSLNCRISFDTLVVRRKLLTSTQSWVIHSHRVTLGWLVHGLAMPSRQSTFTSPSKSSTLLAQALLSLPVHFLCLNPLAFGLI